MSTWTILKRNLYAKSQNNGREFRIINIYDKKSVVELTSSSVNFTKLVETLNYGFRVNDIVSSENTFEVILKKLLSKRDLFFEDVDDRFIQKERLLKNQMINISNSSNLDEVKYKLYAKQFDKQKIYIYDNHLISEIISDKLKKDNFTTHQLFKSGSLEDSVEIDSSAIILLNLEYKDEFLHKYKDIENKVICYGLDTDRLVIGPIIIKNNTGCLNCRQYEDIIGLSNSIYTNNINITHNGDLLYYFIARNIMFIIDGINRYITKDVGLLINKQLEINLTTSMAIARSFIKDPNCSCKERV